MKFLIILLNILMIFPNATTSKKATFEKNVNEAYNYYIFETFEKENFVLEICEGECNSVYSLGFFFASYESDAYYLRITIDDRAYSFDEDSRGDTSCIAISAPNGEVKVIVYDDVDGNSTKRFEYTITNTLEDVKGMSSHLIGNNKGIANETMHRHFKTSSIVIFFAVIFVLVSLIVTGIILYIHKNRKDRNKHNKASNIILSKDEIEDSNYQDIEIVNIIDDNNKTIDVYEKKKHYFNEEEKEFIDIKPYLREKGIDKEYSEMNEEEKNMCMIVLMYLKEMQIITEEQYDKEKVNLWRR